MYNAFFIKTRFYENITCFQRRFHENTEMREKRARKNILEASSWCVLFVIWALQYFKNITKTRNTKSENRC